MEANDPIDGRSNELTRLLAKTGLVDVIAHRHEGLPRTYLRGTQRIDFIFLSPALLPIVRKCGHLGIQDGIPSDHSALWIELDGVKLFRGATPSLASPLSKPFSMQETKKVEKFLTTLEAYFTQHRIQ